MHALIGQFIMNLQRGKPYIVSGFREGGAAMAKKVKKAPMTDVRRIIEDAFTEQVRLIKSIGLTGGPRRMNLTGPLLKRRKEATLAYLPVIQEKYREKCPALDLTKEWGVLCSTRGYPTDSININFSTSLAAAIWILDCLSGSGKLRKTLPLLQFSDEELDQIYLPELSDARYSVQIIYEMVYLIAYRNGPVEESREYMTMASVKRRAPIEYKAPADDRPVCEWTVRERFDAIMEMIPPIYIERAARRFEDAMWAYVDLVMDRTNAYKAEMNRLYEKSKILLQKDPRLSQMAQAIESGSSAYPFASDADISLEQSQSLLTEMLELERKTEVTSVLFRDFAVLSHSLPMERSDHIKLLNSNDAAKVRSLEVCDPYETCFAYLWLLDSGSDLPWLYTAPNFVLLEAARKLPWTAFSGMPSIDEEAEFYGELEEEEETSPEEFDAKKQELIDAMEKSMLKEPPDWLEERTELYQLRYSNLPLYAPLEPPDKDWNINLPQLVYGLSGTIMPRDVSAPKEMTEDLVKAGADPQFAQAMELYLQLAEDCSLPQVNHTFGMDDEEEEPAGEEAPAKPLPEPLPKDERKLLEGQLRAARLEIEQLKAALHTAEKNAQTAGKVQEELREQLHQETQELADLREIVYLLSNTETEAPIEEEAVCFPYTPKQRIAVFGGHDTWLKVIRPMLNNVTFIPRGQRPDADLIRSQDKIWIQPNALGHADFYKILNVVRTHKIPLQYFRYASAKKCALQLVEDDRE